MPVIQLCWSELLFFLCPANHLSATLQMSEEKDPRVMYPCLQVCVEKAYTAGPAL